LGPNNIYFKLQRLLKMGKEKKHTNCDCEMCKNGEDAFLKKQQEILDKYKWIAHLVIDDPEKPFGVNAHTHGLEENFDHLDLQICCAMPPETLHSILVGAVEDHIKKGGKFVSGKRYPKIIAKYDVMFLDAEECERKVLRMIFPDVNGGFDTEFPMAQMSGCAILKTDNYKHN
jgi:hypothetical protein